MMTMITTSPRRTTFLGMCLATALLAGMTPCRGADSTPAPEVKEALAAVRNTQAAVFDVFESSTLGKTATPAEFAATQRDWRAFYSQPPVQLSTADRDALAATFGKVSLIGRPRAVRAFPLGILGAEAIDVDHRPELTVTAVSSDTPAAAGKLAVDDVIVGVNGRVFPEWEDPRVPLGYAIAAAQTKAFNGKLILHVGRDGRIVDVTITLPIAAPYNEDHPYDCERSRQIAADAVASVMKEGDDTFWMDLFLMACGDEQAIALVRDRLRKASTADTLGSNWAPGYTLMSLCEYHLLTGDQEVLPAIRGHVRGLEKNQMFNGGWGHGAPGGYGIMNNVGQTCFIGLVLAEECGVKVDPEVMARAVKLTGRFIGSYGAYGDHPPGVSRYATVGSMYENGQMCTRAVLFHLLGEEAVATRDARLTCYLYRSRMAGHAERIFAIAWSSLAPALAPEADYKKYANNMLWFYELARQRDGSLKNLAYNRYGRNTAAVGMTFATANKRLRIAGAAKGTKPLFPVASLPAAPPPPPDRVAPKPKTETPEPKMAWDVSSVTVPPVKAATELAEAVFSLKDEPKAYELCRVTVPGQMAGELWLNGSCVAIFPKVASHKQALQTLELGRKTISLLKKGENRLALKGAVLDKPTTLETAFAPAQGGATQPAFHKADYGNNGRNGWSGTWEQHRQGVAWFFEGKSPKEIARYLAYPDWMGAQTAFQALAGGGDEAVRLVKQLVADSHAGIRLGAWDAIAEMNTKKLLDTATQQELATLAASRIATEDPSVGMALARAATPMAEGEELSKLLTGIARLEDIAARGTATDTAMARLKGQPELMVPVLRTVIAAKLSNNDIRGLGSAMAGVANVATTPEARGAIPEIAAVLDETSPDTRGMFSNGMMSNGLDVIDLQFDDEVEKTPQLVSGLCRCFAKVPDMDHPAWTFPNPYLRRLIYRLGPGSAAAIDKAVAGMANGAGEPARAEPLAELKAWSATLKKTRGEPAALRAEALRLAASKDPAERLVALSLAWPSDRNIGRGPLDRSAKFADTARLTDPADRLAVAAAAAKHFESNTGTHWLMIWETAKLFNDRPESQQVLVSLPEFFDTVAYRQRGTFMFRAIGTAAGLAQAQLAAPGADTHTLLRGLCKTYSTAGNMVWYTAVRDQLQKIVTPLAATSPQAVAEAETAMQTWLKAAPKEEKQTVFAYGYKVSPGDVSGRLAGLAGKKP
jgi:hypothetical protein